MIPLLLFGVLPTIGVISAVYLFVRTNAVFAVRMEWLNEIRELNAKELYYKAGSFSRAMDRFERFERAPGFSRMVLTFWRRPSSFKPESWT